MAEVAYATTADGLAKKKHTKIIELLPDKRLVFTDAVKYDEDKDMGASLEALHFMTHEHGFTYIGEAGAPQDLEPSAVAESKPSLLQPTSVHLTSRVTLEMLSAASAKGDKAYDRYITRLMLNMDKSFDLREEWRRVYGGSYLFQIAATATDGNTSITFNIKPSDFSPLLMVGSRGMRLDAYQADGTKLNTDAALTVSTYTPIANSGDHTATVVCTGDASDIDAIVAATTDVYFYWRGSYGNQGQGLAYVAGLNSSSGNYLGIATGTYADVWTATQVDFDYSTESFSWTKLNEGIEGASGHGMDAEELFAYPSMRIWRQLCSNLEALRTIDASYSVSRTTVGHEIDSVSYKSVTGASVRIKPSPILKKKHCLVMPKPDASNEICMAGSQKPKFGVPGGGVDTPIFSRIDRTNYVECSMFARQSVWAPCPNQFLLFRPA